MDAGDDSESIDMCQTLLGFERVETTVKDTIKQEHGAPTKKHSVILAPWRFATKERCHHQPMHVASRSIMWSSIPMV
jgi:hypothetical protein